MKSLLKYLTVAIVTALATLFAASKVHKCNDMCSTHGDVFSQGEAIVRWQVHVDTIKYYMPLPKRKSAAVGKAEVKISKNELHDALADLADLHGDTIEGANNDADSISLRLPVEQTMYQDSTYQAWVSGVNANLDSIYVFPKHEIVTIREPTKRWHLGIQGGVGVTSNGVSPYVGVGITYSLFRF